MQMAARTGNEDLNT